MKMLPLKDNALFLQNWRERNRLPIVISAITLLAILIFFIFINAYLNTNYIYTSSSTPEYPSYEKIRVVFPWFKKLINDLAVLQGIILLFFGSLSAFRKASRERSGHTLDFHRSSPTSRSDQIIGLLLGSTSLEWCFFGIIALIQLIVALFNQLSIISILNFNLSLMLCALFYQSIAILIGLSISPNKSKFSGLIFLIAVYFFVHLLVLNKLSFLHNLTWLPPYDQLSLYLKGENYINYRHMIHHNQPNTINMIFGLNIKAPLLQMIVQIPFLAAAFQGISRRFTNTEQPPLSKTTALLTSFYTLLLLSGSIVSQLIYPASKYSNNTESMVLLICSLLILGIINAISSTPTQLAYKKGLRRAKRQGQLKPGAEDNHASNVYLLGVYCFIASIAFLLFTILFKIPLKESIFSLLIILSYIIFFSQFLEYFKLSRHHRKMSLFWTLLTILWVLLPILGLITDKVLNDTLLHQLFFAPSPLFGGIRPIIQTFEQVGNHKGVTLEVSLAVNTLLAIIVTLLAIRERRKLNSEI